jgi:hypothetical protein
MRGVRNKWLFWGFLLAGSQFALMLVYIALQNQGNARADIAALRKIGVPTSEAELVAMAPREGPDASPVYIAYLRHVTELTPTQRTAYSDLRRGRPRASLATQEAEADELRKLVQPVIDFSSYPRMWLAPNFLKNKDPLKGQANATAILRSMSIADESAGKTDQSLVEIRAALAAEKQVDSNPGWGPSYNRLLCLQIYNTIARGHWHNLHVLQTIEQDLSANRPNTDARNLLYMPVIEDVEYSEGKYYPYDPSNPTWFQRVVEKYYNKPRYRRAMAADLTLWQQLFHNLPNGPLDWEATQKTIREAYHRYAIDPAFSQYGSNMYETAHSCDMIGRDIAAWRVTLTGVKLLKALSKTGALPAKLPTSQDSIDPFTHKHLIYKPKGKHFLLYSFGVDRTDNGGKHGRPYTNDPQDIVFRA